MTKWLFPLLLLMMIATGELSAASAAENCPFNPDAPPTAFTDVQVTSRVEDGGMRPTIADAFTPLLLDYLNSRGTPDLEATLNDNLIVMWDNFEAPLFAEVHERDLSGDAVAEVLVLINLFSGAGFSGVIFRFDCMSGQYDGGAIARTGGWKLEGPIDNGVPHIQALADLTGDWLPEIAVLSVENIAAPFFDYGLTIFDANGHQIGHVGLYYAGGDIRDVDADGDFEIVARYPHFEDVSGFEWSRLDRDSEEIWSWNGQGFQNICSDHITPPAYRVQAIQDGGEALLCSHFQQAVVFYQQAIDDDTLLGWSEADNRCPGCDPLRDYEQWAVMAFTAREDGYPVPDMNERPRLTAYARYRLVVAYAALGQLDLAQEQLTILKRDFPSASIGHEYVLLAETFLEAITGGVDTAVACAQVNTEAASAGVESPLNAYNFSGVIVSPGNVKQEEVCPL